MDYFELEEVNNSPNIENRNVDKYYDRKWKVHYEGHDIIKNLKLDKNKFAESIENIRKLGHSSVQNYFFDKKARDIHTLKLEYSRDDELITTNRGKNEDITEYLKRLDVSNFNYVILENLMQMLLVTKANNDDVDELFSLVVLKLGQRAQDIEEQSSFDSVMDKVHKSVEDVKAYVKAGALDEFMRSFISIKDDLANFANGNIDTAPQKAKNDYTGPNLNLYDKIEKDDDDKNLDFLSPVNEESDLHSDDENKDKQIKEDYVLKMKQIDAQIDEGALAFVNSLNTLFGTIIDGENNQDPYYDGLAALARQYMNEFDSVIYTKAVLESRSAGNYYVTKVNIAAKLAEMLGIENQSDITNYVKPCLSRIKQFSSVVPSFWFDERSKEEMRWLKEYLVSYREQHDLYK